jgi:FMN reductase
MNLTVVVGNPKADSRTLGVALAAADALASRASNIQKGTVVDLADVAAELFDPDSSAVSDLLATVAASDVLIVGSPTFKATYTGLLKAFFDRYSTNALTGVVAVALMTGAAPLHTLAVDVHLRPLLVELGASLPTRSLYVVEAQFADLDAVVGSWADVASPLVERALGAPTS